jgi:fatty acid desaturase
MSIYIVDQSTDTFSFYLQSPSYLLFRFATFYLSVYISVYPIIATFHARVRSLLLGPASNELASATAAKSLTAFRTRCFQPCAALCALLLYVLPCPVVCSGFHFPCTSPIPLHSDMSGRPHRTTQRLATTSKLQRVQSVRQSADSSLLLAFVRVHKTSQTVVNRSFLESLRRGAWRPQWL